MVAQVRERLAEQTFDVEMFNPKNLSELDDREQYQTEISDRFAALTKLNYGDYVSRIWGKN